MQLYVVDKLSFFNINLEGSSIYKLAKLQMNSVPKSMLLQQRF